MISNLIGMVSSLFTGTVLSVLINTEQYALAGVLSIGLVLLVISAVLKMVEISKS